MHQINSAIHELPGAEAIELDFISDAAEGDIYFEVHFRVGTVDYVVMGV